MKELILSNLIKCFLPSTNKICDRSKSVGLIHIQNLLFYRIVFSK